MKMILLLLVKPFELQEHGGKAATADNKVMKIHVETKIRPTSLSNISVSIWGSGSLAVVLSGLYRIVTTQSAPSTQMRL